MSGTATVPKFMRLGAGTISASMQAMKSLARHIVSITATLLVVAPSQVSAAPSPRPYDPGRRLPRPATPETEPARQGDPRDSIMRRPGKRAPEVKIVDPTTPGASGRGAADPASGRGLVAPTALLAPAGARGFSVRTPLGPMGHAVVSYTPITRLELGAGLFVTSAGDEPTTGGGTGTVRVQLARSQRAAVAAFGEIYAVGTGTLVTAGLVTSVCVDGVACRVLVSVHGGTVQATAGRSYPVAGGGSFAIGRRYQVIGEATAAPRDGEIDGLAYLGGRLLYGPLAFDAGAVFARGLGLCRLSCTDLPQATLGPAIAVTVRN